MVQSGFRYTITEQGDEGILLAALKINVYWNWLFVFLMEVILTLKITNPPQRIRNLLRAFSLQRQTSREL